MTAFAWRIYRPTATKTVAYTLTHADSHTIFDNMGDVTAAPGTVFTLPATTGLNFGTNYTVTNQTVGGLQLKAAAGDVIRFPGSDSSSGGTQTTATIGAAVTLIKVSTGFWNVIGGVAGSWTGV